MNPSHPLSSRPSRHGQSTWPRAHATRLLSLVPALVLAVAAVCCLAQDAEASQRGRRQRSAPKRTIAELPVALVVLMENGGVAANLEACLGRGAGKKRITVATAGSVSIPLPTKGGLPKALKDAAISLRQLSAPLKPSKWTLETITMDEWVERTSDLLLEELVKVLHAKNGMDSIYSKVVILEDDKLTPERAVQVIAGFARTHKVDVHTLVHGRSNEFIGGQDKVFNEVNFFAPIRASGVDVRAVYQMNCVSGTLIDEWLSLGAEVVNGTLGTKNNYMPQQYFHFQKAWAGGATFGGAITQSYANARQYSEPAYETIGRIQDVEDSRMQVKGQTGLRAKPTLLEIAKPVAIGAINAGAKTIDQIARDLKDAGKSLQQTIEALMAQGHSAAAAVKAAAACHSANLAKSIKAMVKAGLSTAETITVCRSTFNASYGDIVSGLHAAGSKCSSIASALKDRGKSAKAVCKWVRDAGFGTRTIVKAMRVQLDCDVATIVDVLKKAGAPFVDVASSVWKDAASHLPQSKIPAALANLASVMASEFNYSAAYVASEFARLGIQ